MNGKNILKYLFEQEPEGNPPPKEGKVNLTPRQEEEYDRLYSKYFDMGQKTHSEIHRIVLKRLGIRQTGNQA